jgi:hypothetical protein
MRDGHLEGYEVGVIRLRDLLDVALHRSLARGFALALFDGAELIYGARPEEAGDAIGYARDAAFVRDGLVWRLEMWPSDDMARRLDTRAPAAILGLGILLAFFVAVALHLYRVANPVTGAAESVAASKDEAERVPAERE